MKQRGNVHMLVWKRVKVRINVRKVENLTLIKLIPNTEVAEFCAYLQCYWQDVVLFYAHVVKCN